MVGATVDTESEASAMVGIYVCIERENKPTTTTIIIIFFSFLN